MVFLMETGGLSTIVMEHHKTYPIIIFAIIRDMYGRIMTNYDHVSRVVLMSLLLTLNIFHTLF